MWCPIPSSAASDPGDFHLNSSDFVVTKRIISARSFSTHPVNVYSSWHTIFKKDLSKTFKNRIRPHCLPRNNNSDLIERICFIRFSRISHLESRFETAVSSDARALLTVAKSIITRSSVFVLKAIGLSIVMFAIRLDSSVKTTFAFNALCSSTIIYNQIWISCNAIT